MAKCDVCGNNYDKSFEVRMAGKTYTFDSFECAIHKLAGVRALRVPHHRAWDGERRPNVLLRDVRGALGCPRDGRSGARNRGAGLKTRPYS
jgi:hypothetical protein